MASDPLNLSEAPPATFEQLAECERDFEDVDVEMTARQYLLTKPIFARRAELIAKIPNFWSLVLEQVTPDIDQFIQPSDSALLAASIKDISVTRFEVKETLPPPRDRPVPVVELGEPRSLAFRFEFSENDWFEDTVLEKKFWYRRAKDGWQGLVSEPVKIHWKRGKDLTGGLLNMAVELHEARAREDSGSSSNGAGGQQPQQRLPQETAIKKELDATTEESQSFFAWFGYVGRRVSAEESAEATQKMIAKQEAARTAGSDPMRVDDDDIATLQDSIAGVDQYEIFPRGEDLAVALAEDLWPSATGYFTTAQEDPISDLDFEDGDLEDVDGDGLLLDGSSDDEEGNQNGKLDIRGLVRPNKRRKM